MEKGQELAMVNVSLSLGEAKGSIERERRGGFPEAGLAPTSTMGGREGKGVGAKASQGWMPVATNTSLEPQFPRVPK